MIPASLIAWMLTVLFTVPAALMALELLQPRYAAPLWGLLAGWLCLLAMEAFRDATARADGVGARRWGRLPAALVTIAGCIAWIAFSGIGSLAVCRWDYVKHNIIFSALLDQRLPITLNDGSFILHYPFSYYISPVRLTQLLQWIGAPVSLDALLLIFYSLTAFLSVTLMARESRVPALAMLAAIVLVGGWDVPGMKIFGVPVQTAPFGSLAIPVPWNLEWWGLPYAPQSVTANLYWAPQHAFGALIGVPLIMHFVNVRRSNFFAVGNAGIILLASSFWSPYVAVGLAGLATVRLLFIDFSALTATTSRQGLGLLYSPRTLLGAGLGLSLLGFAILFFLAAVPLSRPDILILRDYETWVGTYLFNYAPFLVVGALAVRKASIDPAYADASTLEARRLVAECGGLLIASAVTLAVAHGTYNDWGMRTTLPLWLALVAVALRYLFALAGPRSRVVVLGVLVLSSADSFAEIAISVLHAPNCLPYGSFQIRDMGELASQYQGRPDSLLYLYFSQNH